MPFKDSSGRVGVPKLELRTVIQDNNYIRLKAIKDSPYVSISLRQVRSTKKSVKVLRADLKKMAKWILANL